MNNEKYIKSKNVSKHTYPNMMLDVWLLVVHSGCGRYFRVLERFFYNQNENVRKSMQKVEPKERTE